MKKRLITAFVATMVCLFALFSAVGCLMVKQTQEDMAYNIVSSVAKKQKVDLEDTTVISGSITVTTKDFQSYHVACMIVKFGEETVYFSANYAGSRVTSCTDMTALGENVTLGPAYYETDSFDIQAVNDRLHGVAQAE